MTALFARAGHYRKYRLVDISDDYEDFFKNALRFWKQTGVQMRSQGFSGSDTIAVLGFLVTFEKACSLYRVPESTAMCCFQFYMNGQVEPFLLTRSTESVMAVSSESSEMLQTYKYTAILVLLAYEKEKIIVEAYSDVVDVLQSLSVIKKTFF